MKLAIAVVRRFDLARAALLEQQQDLAIAGLHTAAALSEFTDNAEPENSLVEPC